MASSRKIHYLTSWLILGCLIGTISGISAVVFAQTLHYVTSFSLTFLGHYQIPTPFRENGLSGSSQFLHPWIIPLITACGAFLSSLLVLLLAPEAAGPGVDNAIEAMHIDPRCIRTRVIFVKIIASALLGGSGGSGGQAGPTAHISAACASWITRWLKLPDASGRIIVTVSIGAGIGAILNAPLGGAILAISVAYRRDMDYRLLMPSFITSGVAYLVHGWLTNFNPMFGFVDLQWNSTDLLSLLWFISIGIISAVFGYLYVQIYYGIHSIHLAIPYEQVLKPTIGGFFVGILALYIPQVLGSGYGWVQAILNPSVLMTIPLWIILLLPLAKIIATSLSIGTGGCGGLFGPGLVTGAFLGAALWRIGTILHLPGIPIQPGVFILVSMMACFSSVTHTPLALIVIISEMAGSFTVIPGAVLAVGTATFLMAPYHVTLYRAQQQDRRAAAAKRRHYRQNAHIDN